jgi:small subunit ribosomal protein S6
MNHYEIVLMVHPDQSAKLVDMIKEYQNIILSQCGKVHRIEDWGRSQLSYPIARLHKAHYVLMNIECNGEALDKLNYAINYNDAILRRLVIKKKRSRILRVDNDENKKKPKR